ncbi:hypothetical protein [Flavobacterium psychraquaticum]|uniref:hypothetical protein n=1 Tax=Flavobacterium psychraquaticum TaxID=3103958 RepID=UPI002ACE4854|nr:hypothetical protein [Flavobacterium sp. LB-N7T]
MYEKRFVLFLDILGFQKIIEETEKNEEPQNEKIEELILALKEMVKTVSPMPKETSKIVTQFSDSIVVSFKDNDLKESELFFRYVHRLIIKLAAKKILCRGAVSYGNLYHDKNFIFGPALVDAYLTESQAAMYPRVIFDKSVIDIMKKRLVSNPSSYSGIRFDSRIETYLKTDLDDKLYFDYFSKAAYYFRGKELNEYYDTLRKIIIDGNKYKNPGVKVKYGWMKNKYNKLKTDFDKADEDEEIYLSRDDVNKFANKFKEI